MTTVYIGMGSNVASHAGSPESTLAAAALRLNSLGCVMRRSSLYSTEPVGFADQPRFLNAVVELETNLEPRSLLEGLLAVEKEFGRDRSSGILNGPRTLDLDILLYGDRLIRAAGLEIPHPRLRERAFVLVPLSEIASNVVDVTSQNTVSQLLHTLPNGAPDQQDAIHSVQSDIWRAGALRDGRSSGGRPCPASRAPDADG
jgi:2-amino-4-hydroxy-6-hydroxymethyldihydropteridine diphosphokinase